MKENCLLIKYKYEMGGYTLDEIIDLVKRKLVTESEFKEITTFDYKGLEKLKKGTD